MSTRRIWILLSALAMLTACSGAGVRYDTILRGGTIYDGSGSEPFVADLAIDGDRIAAIGALDRASGVRELDVTGQAVAPGFINMMSWANESLIEDGRSQSNIRQGVTLEVMGEGFSMGPLNPAMKADMIAQQGDIRYDIEWTSLDEYLQFLEDRGVSPNVASFIGAANPREYVIGQEDRPATAAELEAMRGLVKQAMEQGALGVASSLIYPPGSFADTDELVALSEVAARYDGMYISHLRDEGANMLAAVEELIEIARRAGIRAEIYHIKSSGRQNWHLFDRAVDMVEQARKDGLRITADVYTYPAGATGLNAAIPPWVQEGGFEASLRRMADPDLRDRIAGEMLQHSTEWENLYLGAGTPDNILLVGFRNHRHGPDHRGQQPDRYRLFHPVRGRGAQGRLAALGQLQFRRRFTRTGRGFSQAQSASAGLRQLCPGPGEICARRAGHPAAGSHP